MKLGRCPACKAHLDLHALVEDEAGRELMAQLAKLPTRLAGPLLAYLGLFRPAKQDLANHRSLALLQEALALTSDHYLLAAAMTETVTQIHANRLDGSNHTPLKNHRYLKKVITGIADRIGQTVQAGTPAASDAPAPRDKAAEDRANFEAYKRQMEAFGMTVLEDGRAVKMTEGKNHE